MGSVWRLNYVYYASRWICFRLDFVLILLGLYFSRVLVIEELREEEYDTNGILYSKLRNVGTAVILYRQILSKHG